MSLRIRCRLNSFARKQSDGWRRTEGGGEDAGKNGVVGVDAGDDGKEVEEGDGGDAETVQFLREQMNTLGDASLVKKMADVAKMTSEVLPKDIDVEKMEDLVDEIQSSRDAIKQTHRRVSRRRDLEWRRGAAKGAERVGWTPDGAEGIPPA